MEPLTNQNLQIVDVLYDDEMWTGEVSQMHSIEDAYVLSINQFGKANLQFIASLCGNSEEEIISKLEGKLIWRNPARYNPVSPYENWLTREQYVRGNIYRLLEEAKEQNRKTGLFTANIKLLTSELPKGPKPGELIVTLGATWVPKKYYLEFICDLLDIRTNQPSLCYDTYFNRWELKYRSDFFNIRNSKVYGTNRMTAIQIIKKTMNKKLIMVPAFRTWMNRQGGKG